MQQPPVFREERPDVLHDMIRTHPFATLVTQPGGRLDADHVPMVLDVTDGGATLHGHIHAANPLVRHAGEPGEGLALFHGPHTYVSPGWYASKAEHGRAVPTWNYVAVHARGPLRLIRDRGWLVAHLRALGAQHESHRAEPWRLEDAPIDYTETLLRGIVGVELTVASLSGVWKLSQNKSEADRAGVRAGLAAEGSAVADLIP